MTAPQPRVLTATEAAEQLHLPLSTVRQLLWRGELTGVRCGGVNAGWRVTSVEVARFRLAASTSATPAPAPRFALNEDEHDPPEAVRRTGTDRGRTH